MQGEGLHSITLLAALAAFSPLLNAQRGGSRGPDGASRPKALETLEVPSEPGIAWFGTWESGLAEARRTGRPILLMSAAPQCHGVPGMWWLGYRAADRSVLSQNEVFAASREFGCIRPQTY